MRDPERQEQQRQQQDGDVEHGLPTDAKPLRREVRVGVAGKKYSLKEEDGGIPYRRRAAEERNDQLGEHRLD
jgi:hypothetical protein